MPKIEAKIYQKKFIENLYSKKYENVSENTGDVFPKNEISVDLYSYSGTYENKNKENIPYEGIKVEITNFKLSLEDGNVVRKKKSVNDRVVDDKTQVSMSEDDYKDLILSYQN